MTTTDSPTPTKPRGLALEVAAVIGLCLASVIVKLLFEVAPSAWSNAIVVAWQVPVVIVLFRVAKARGESLDVVSAPLTRDAAWDLALLFVAGSAVYAAVYSVGARLAPELAETAWRASPRIIRDSGALPALLLAAVGPMVGAALLRGHLQTRLCQLHWPASATIALSVALQASLYFERGLLPMVALGAQFLVFALYSHRTRRLWPVLIAHTMQSVIGLAALSRHHF